MIGRLDYSINAPKPDIASGSGGASTENVTFQGGEVINNPQFYNVFVGDWSSSANQARAATFNKFIQDLVGSNWMSIFNSYGITKPGAFVKQINISNPSVTATSETNSDVENIIQNAISQGIVPEPSNVENNQVFILYMPNGVGIIDQAGLCISMCTSGANSFGYHYYFITNKGNQVYYMVIPSLDDACLQQTCATDSGCSLKLSQSQQDRQTQVLSHEIAELLTNPEGNSGWYDKSSGQEIGDICNGEPVPLTINGDTWAVQKIFSQAMNSCVVSSSSTGPAPSTDLLDNLNMAELGPQLEAALQNPLNIVVAIAFMFAVYMIAKGTGRALGIMLLVGLIGGFAITSILAKPSSK